MHVHEHTFMHEVVLHTLTDSVKTLPFLFLAYLIIEFFEHRSNDKIEKILSRSGKWGVLFGSLLGSFPQCGFSVAAANFYAGKVITPGTLIAVFVATSDEAIPLLLTHPDFGAPLLGFIIIKIIIAILAGLIVDHFIIKHDDPDFHHIHNICEHCNCNNNGILPAALKHTIQIFLYMVIVTLVLNATIFFIGEENLSELLINGSIFQPLIAALLGFVPNCAISVVLTELYMSGSISFGSIVAGLSTGAGIAIAVLFKVNKNFRDSVKIAVILYIIGAVTGILLQICELYNILPF